VSLRFIDILIGLSVILGGLSLIVTLLVQAVGALLALRGSNLRWGLETLLKTIDGAAHQTHAREIAEQRRGLQVGQQGNDLGRTQSTARRDPWAAAGALRSAHSVEGGRGDSAAGVAAAGHRRRRPRVTGGRRARPSECSRAEVGAAFAHGRDDSALASCDAGALHWMEIPRRSAGQVAAPSP
jgi:hypothetical protein